MDALTCSKRTEPGDPLYKTGVWHYEGNDAQQTLMQLTRFGALNCYPVREDDGFTLIDSREI